MRDLMLDLETFGTKPGCVIRSVGAVMFDPAGEGVGAQFYVNVDRASCEAVGLKVDPGTEAWWAKQSKAAQDALLVDPQPLDAALQQFTSFFVTCGAIRVWSHGANFDEPILAACYHAVGLPEPWKFWDSRCTRTLYDLAGIDTKKAARAGTHHNTLDDTKFQVACAQAAMRRLGLSKTTKPGVFA